MIQRQRQPARERADLTADENNLRIMVAGVEAYRRDHRGRLPKAPGELVPRYLRTLPLDPANGLPYAIVVIAGSSRRTRSMTRVGSLAISSARYMGCRPRVCGMITRVV